MLNIIIIIMLLSILVISAVFLDIARIKRIKLQKKYDKLLEDFDMLKSASVDLYYAAYWKSDRLTEEEEKELWTEFRNAAKIKPKWSRMILGPSRWNEKEVMLIEDQK